MRIRSALLTLSLICTFTIADAATPQEVWQNYQNQQPIVGTKPQKKPNATTPTTAIIKPAPTKPAVDAEVSPEAIDEIEPDSKTAPQAKAANENDSIGQSANTANNSAVTTVEDLASTTEKVAAAADATGQPVVGTKPTPGKKPKPKLILVGKPPIPQQVLRTPQTSDFVLVNSPAGYTIQLPKSFGADPLADLPNAQGAMNVRTSGDTLYCAVTIIDPADATNFKNDIALPTFNNKHIYWQWDQGNNHLWHCVLSRHDDYHGDKLLLEASHEQNGKTYQLLYVFPPDKMSSLLPQALSSLESMVIK